jgi:hypothetical protein
VGAVQVIDDLVDALFSGGTADFRLRAGAEAFGDADAELDDRSAWSWSAPGHPCWRRRSDARRPAIALLTRCRRAADAEHVIEASAR